MPRGSAVNIWNQTHLDPRGLPVTQFDLVVFQRVQVGVQRSAMGLLCRSGDSSVVEQAWCLPAPDPPPDPSLLRSMGLPCPAFSPTPYQKWWWTLSACCSSDSMRPIPDSLLSLTLLPASLKPKSLKRDPGVHFPFHEHFKTSAFTTKLEDWTPSFPACFVPLL